MILFPGIAQELLISTALTAAAFGAGDLLFFRRETAAVVRLACGVALLALASLLLPMTVMRWLWLPLAPWGAWRAWPHVRKSPWVSAVTALLLAATCASALLPPFTWDEQLYQTALLRHYAEAGNFAVVPDNPYSAYPSLAHAFLLCGFSHGGATLPKLTVWLLTGILGAAFFQEMRRFGIIPALAATAAILLSPLSLTLAQSSYAENFILLFGFAGVKALLDERFDDRAALAAGIAAGAACAVKLTGGGTALALLILLLARAAKERKRVVIFFAAALVTALPFFVRVFLATGNPVYPFFGALFGAGEAELQMERFFRLLGSRYGTAPGYGLCLNWLLTAWRGEFYDGIVLGWSFPLLFLTSLAGSYRVGRNTPEARPRLWGCAAALIAAYLFWVFTAQQSRFLAPVLWGAAALALAVYAKMSRKFRKITALVFLLALAGTVIFQSMPRLRHYYISWRALNPARQEPGAFASGRDAAYARLLTDLARLPETARIGLLAERRTLYLPRKAEILMPFFQKRLTPIPADAGQLWQTVKDFDYLVLQFPAADVDRLPELDEEFSRLYALLDELRRQKKVELLPGFQTAILRVADEGADAGTAR